jgi:hypothetical protein
VSGGVQFRVDPVPTDAERRAIEAVLVAEIRRPPLDTPRSYDHRARRGRRMPASPRR